MQFNKNVEFFEFKSSRPTSKNLTTGFSYTKYKKQFTFSQRDFYEKSFNFCYNGVFYRFATSIVDSESGKNPLKPKDPKIVRGLSTINIAMIWRNPADGRIFHHQLTQYDFKMKLPSFLLTTFFPKACKQWYEGMNKHYVKNHKKI